MSSRYPREQPSIYQQRLGRASWIHGAYEGRADAQGRRAQSGISSHGKVAANRLDRISGRHPLTMRGSTARDNLGQILILG